MKDLNDIWIDERQCKMVLGLWSFYITKAYIWVTAMPRIEDAFDLGLCLSPCFCQEFSHRGIDIENDSVLSS